MKNLMIIVSLLTMFGAIGCGSGGAGAWAGKDCPRDIFDNVMKDIRVNPTKDNCLKQIERIKKYDGCNDKGEKFLFDLAIKHCNGMP